MEEQKDLGKYMEKEIYEIPLCLKRILEKKLVITNIAQELITRKTEHIYLVGAGSSYPAGFVLYV